MFPKLDFLSKYIYIETYYCKLLLNFNNPQFFSESKNKPRRLDSFTKIECSRLVFIIIIADPHG